MREDESSKWGDYRRHEGHLTKGLNSQRKEMPTCGGFSERARVTGKENEEKKEEEGPPGKQKENGWVCTGRVKWDAQLIRPGKKFTKQEKKRKGKENTWRKLRLRDKREKG